MRRRVYARSPTPSNVTKEEIIKRSQFYSQQRKRSLPPFEPSLGNGRCGLFLHHPPLEGGEIPLKGIRQRLRPHIPDILAARARLVLDGLLPVVIAKDLLAMPVRVRPRLHAQPEVLPVLAARPQFAVPIHVHPLATEGLAEEGVVECGAAGHGVGV